MAIEIESSTRWKERVPGMAHGHEKVSMKNTQKIYIAMHFGDHN